MSGQDQTAADVQKTPVHRDPWWHYLLFHLFALVGSVGLVGLAFELISRGQLFSEFVKKMQELFDEDPALARSLSDEARQKRVENSLKAHLGEEGGQAIYDAIVRRYMTHRNPFRRDITYEATVYDLEGNVILGEGADTLTLSPDHYHRLVVSWSFRRPYEKYDYVGCILVEENEELYEWFNRSDCLYREIVDLDREDRERISALLDGREGAHRVIEKLFKVEVRINGHPIGVSQPLLRNSRKSAEIRLQTPKRVTGEFALFEIQTSAVLARSARSHRFHVVEPSSNPRITFNYPAAGIKNVVTAPLFAGETPFQPIVKHRETLRRVDITLPVGSHNATWVFPNSGVIFTWDDG